MKIKGVSVQLVVETVTSADPFGAPITTETEETVDNILVSPTSDTEAAEALSLYGKRSIYTLGIPKGDAHVWEDRKVRFFGRTFRTIGFLTQGITENIPGPWDKKIQVASYE